MTASDILHIASTVAVCQAICDMLARYMVFHTEKYERAVSAMERSRWKLQKAQADAAKNTDKHVKRLKRAEEDYGEACSAVAQKHGSAGLYTSIFFFMLLRILGTEYRHNVVALLPFVPYDIIQRLSARGLDWTSLTPDNANALLYGSTVSHKQGASFLFVYILTTLSVKYFVNKAIGVQPPPGADNGLTTIMESPAVKRFMKSMGVDPDELK